MNVEQPVPSKERRQKHRVALDHFREERDYSSIWQCAMFLKGVTQ